MTKLASALPDGHGLDGRIRETLLADPRQRHVVVAVLNTSKITRDLDKGEMEPTAAIRTIEPVTPDDLPLAEQILTRGRDRRLGSTLLPLGIEDSVLAAFKVRSEDITTDLASDTQHLDDSQVKALAASLDVPLRRELHEAISTLRAAKNWVSLGRARRVLDLAARALEENDKNLLRDADGNLIDPATGEVVDEDKLTTEDLDDMLANLFNNTTAGDQGEQDDEDDCAPEHTPASGVDESPAAIREWAAANGYQIGTRGRIHETIRAAYMAAHTTSKSAAQVNEFVDDEDELPTCAAQFGGDDSPYCTLIAGHTGDHYDEDNDVSFTGIGYQEPTDDEDDQDDEGAGSDQ